jgi:hypothetical protein
MCIVVVKCKFKFLLFAQEAKAVPPLSSLIGQFGINCLEFCQQFNEQTKLYGCGIPVSVTFFVLNERKFSFNVNGVALNKLFFFFLKSRRSVRVLNVYKLYTLLNKIYGLGERTNVFMKFSTFIGSIKAVRVKRILL